MRPARKEIRIGARRLTYFDQGTGRPIVLIHAFPLHAAMWEPQIGAVPPGWRLIAPDVRGFGESALSSDGPPASSLDDYADDVLALLDRLAIERAVIGGLSMGGYITFGLLRRAPERFEGIVLADTRSGADSAEGRDGRREMQAVVASDGTAAIARLLLPKLLGRETHRRAPTVVERVRAIIESAGASAIHTALECMLQRPDSGPLLHSIRVPTLILVGADDVLTPPAESEAMQRQIAGAELTVIARAGHLSSLEQPEPFNRALARFCVSRF